MGSKWGPPGADRTQMGPMLAPWILLSGLQHFRERCQVWQKGLSLGGTLRLNWSRLKHFWNLAFVICIEQRTWQPAHILLRYSCYKHESLKNNNLLRWCLNIETFSAKLTFTGESSITDGLYSKRRGPVLHPCMYTLSKAWTSFWANNHLSVL